MGFHSRALGLAGQGKRLTFTEHPHTSATLLRPAMPTRPELCKATVAQCMFGFSDPESGKWYRKRTRLDTNHQRFVEALEAGSQCSHSKEEHEPIFCSTHLSDGRAVPRSTWASRFDPNLAQHILHCARDVLDAGWE